MGRYFEHRAWIAVTCGLCVAALLVVGPERAEASCGDWLVHANDPSSAQGHGAASQRGRNIGPPAFDDEQSARWPASTPCDGPYCRSAPAQPAPTAPVTVTSSTDRLALAGDTPASCADSRQFFQSDDTDDRPARGFPRRIDHPPRG